MKKLIALDVYTETFRSYPSCFDIIGYNHIVIYFTIIILVQLISKVVWVICRWNWLDSQWHCVAILLSRSTEIITQCLNHFATSICTQSVTGWLSWYRLYRGDRLKTPTWMYLDQLDSKYKRHIHLTKHVTDTKNRILVCCFR